MPINSYLPAFAYQVRFRRKDFIPSANPVACHKIAPVPLHWKSRVKVDLDRDVALGVLEKVPDNIPVKWLSRMVITAKGNGEPRRTIDYQPLNRQALCQPFPVQSSFQLASQVPAKTKKSMVDAWNRYRQIPSTPTTDSTPPS